MTTFREVPPTAPAQVEAGRESLIVDVAAPATVVLYLLITFRPLDLVLLFPWAFSWLVFPALGLAVLLMTPTERLASIPVSLPVVGVLTWWTLSYLWSDSRMFSRPLIMGEVIPLAVLMLVVGTMQPRVVARTVLWTFVALCGWSLVASLTMPAARAAVLGVGSEGLQEGFRGTFIHKNLMGIFVVYAFCVVLPFARGWYRPFVIGLCVALMFTTRSATVGSGLMAVVFVWFWILAIDSQKKPRERQFLLVLSLMSAFGAILLALGLMPALLDLYQKDFTFSGRTFIWEESMVTVARQPIQGYGLGGVWFDGRSPVTSDLHRRIGFGAAHAHNGAIQVLLEVGIVGLGLVVVMFGRLVRLATAAFRRPETAPYGQWGLLTVVALLLMSISEPLFKVPDLGLVVIIITVLTRLWNDERRRGRTKRFATTF